MRQLAAVAIAFALLLLSAPAAPAAQLEFVEPDAIALTAEDKKSSHTNVWLRNTGAAVRPTFGVEGQDADERELTTADREKRAKVVVVDDDDEKSAAAEIPERSVKRYRLRIEGPSANQGLTGQLVASAAGHEPASVDLTVAPRAVVDIGVNNVLGIITVLTALAMAVHFGLMKSDRGPKGEMSDLLPEANYDFKTSFASTLTAGGALLSTIIAAGVLPDETISFTKEGFTALSLLFGTAVVVGALVYSASERQVVEEVDGEDKAVRRGSVRAFFLACAITLWATLGQLWVAWMLVDELTSKQGFSAFAGYALKALVAGAVIAILLSTRRIQWALTKVVRKKAAPADKQQDQVATPTYAPVGSATSMGDDPIAYL